MHSTLLFLPTPCFCSQLFRSGSQVVLIFLYLVVYNLHQLWMHTVIFSLRVSSYFAAWGDFCLRARTAAKGLGPSLSHLEPITWGKTVDEEILLLAPWMLIDFSGLVNMNLRTQTHLGEIHLVTSLLIWEDHPVIPLLGLTSGEDSSTLRKCSNHI